MSILSLTRFTILALVPVASLAEAAVLPFTPNNPTTPSFQRRQCKWDDEEDGYYDCDDKLPSLEQLVERMHDTSNYGKADAEHHAVFYTNLGDSATAPGGNPQLAWLHGWLKNENLEYYWVNDALDKLCMYVPEVGLDLFSSLVLVFVDQEEWIKKNPEKFEAQWGDKAPTTFTHCLFQALSVAAIIRMRTSLRRRANRGRMTPFGRQLNILLSPRIRIFSAYGGQIPALPRLKVSQQRRIVSWTRKSCSGNVAEMQSYH